MNDSSWEAGSAAGADERGEAGSEPGAVGVVGGQGALELGLGLSGESDSRMPHSAFTISPSAQKAIPSP